MSRTFYIAPGAVLLAAVSGLPGCSSPDAGACVDWKADVAPALAADCARCHGEDDAEGRYRVDTYLQAIGNGSDRVANAVAGDGGSVLVRKLGEAPAGDPHAGHADTAALVRRWVVDCRLAWSLTSPHEPGILNPADQEQFHRVRVEAARYDLSVCADCHGQDLTGGRGGDCTGCHANPMTSCQACHQNLTTGAHADHMQSGLGRGWCGACHLMPRGLLDPGHVLTADGDIDPPPAEVTFAAVASTGIAGGATYDAATGACTVWCHGDAIPDANRSGGPMRWWGAWGSGTCTSCHGMPPESHDVVSDCSDCHGLSAAHPFDAAFHIDGAISFGTPDAGCTGCHGGGLWGTPPPDLSGSTDTARLGVGAHTSHRVPPLGLRGPIPCGDCHVFPTTMEDPAHVDAWLPAEVFPEAIAPTSLAFASGATPAWDPTTRTCNDYCHGNSSVFTADTAPGRNRQPDWTSVGAGAVGCGSCHGIPPADGFHNSTLTRTDCHTCHVQTVDAGGSIIVTTGQSTHINGTVDF